MKMYVYSTNVRHESLCFILLFYRHMLPTWKVLCCLSKIKTGKLRWHVSKTPGLSLFNIVILLSGRFSFWKVCPCYRAVYEELGKYGDLENQVLCRERVEELEPSIRYCLHKIGKSNLQTSELLQIGEMEGPALDLFKAKIEVRINIHNWISLSVSVTSKASE